MRSAAPVGTYEGVSLIVRLSQSIRLRFLTLALAIAMLAALAFAQTLVGKVVGVADGDTVALPSTSNEAFSDALKLAGYTEYAHFKGPAFLIKTLWHYPEN